MAPREQRVLVRDVELAYFEWGRAGTGATVLLAHATGFHGRCWDAVVRALGEVHVIALDQRGHGRSGKRGPYDWRVFGSDLAAFVETLALEGIVGVGHSMGGHSLMQAASQRGDRFRKLLLVDPVILDPEAYAEHQRQPAFASAEDHPVSKRRNRWPSIDAMIQRFADRHPFSLWQPDVLEDYCRYGLLPDHGAWVLACPPLVEAAIYVGSAGSDIADLIATLPHPVRVLRAHRKKERDGPMDFSQSPTWEGLAEALPNGEDVYLPELTHFIPMQRPDLVAVHIRELIGG